jgi:PqqD family protein of HPr-rel-A system
MEQVDQVSDVAWQIAAPEALSLRAWDGESVVFDGRSGATHLLAAGTTLLLRVLQESPSPMTLPALMEAIRARLASECDPADVEGAVLALERLGLVRSSRP